MTTPRLKRHLPHHPKADFAGNVQEHVLAAEKMLGRSLKKGELIHHVDWNPTNNEPNNLYITDRKTHHKIPELQALFLEEKELLDEFREWLDSTGRLEAQIRRAEKITGALKRQIDGNDLDE